MLRRVLITRAAAAITPALMAGCSWSPRPAAPLERLRLIATATEERLAKLNLWNSREGPESNTVLELATVPAGLANESVARIFAADAIPAHLLWLDAEELPALARLGRLRPLGALAGRDRYDLKRFMPAALQPGFGLDEQLYLLPEEIETRQLYFNREHLDAARVDIRRAGLDFESAAATWDSLRLANLDLVSAPRAVARQPMDLGSDGAPLEMWGWQNRGQWLSSDGRRATFARPENVQALSWLASHSRELSGAQRTAADASDAAGRVPARWEPDSGAPERSPFLAGRLSMAIDTTRLISTIAAWRPQFPVGYVQVPSRYWGWPLAPLARSAGYALVAGAPEAAWLPLQFLLSADAIDVAMETLAQLAPLSPVGGANAPGGVAPLPGRPLLYPPFSGQLKQDRRLGQRFRTGSKVLDEGHDHGLEQLRHACFRPPCVAPREVWRAVANARQSVLQSGVAPEAALASAQELAQAAINRHLSGRSL